MCVSVYLNNNNTRVPDKNVLLLSNYKFIVIPIKYHNFGGFVYDSAEKQMLSTISLDIEQQKNEFDRISKVRFSPIYSYALRGPVILQGSNIYNF
jgi:hypothetical protein